jgi:PAS domain S-box-containing protein
MSRPSPVDPARFHLAAIVESSDDAIVSKDLDGIIQSWNTGAERLFGYRAAEVIGRSISILVPADRPDEEPGILARIRRGERVEHYETVRVRKDGGSIDVSITVSPIWDEAGRIIGASKIARGIGGRKKADEAAAHLAAIVSSSDDAIVGKTLDGNIVSWNTGAERLFGYRADEVIGRSITVLIPADRLHEETEILSRIRRGERVEHFQSLRVRKDGSPVDVSLTISPVRDAGGTIIGASKIARDISSRRREEKEREELLTREQQARAEAESANRAKDDFLATLSHELRTPLNAILGWTHVLDRTRHDPRMVERAIETITRNARQQALLIDDLLDLTRIMGGRLRLNTRPVDLVAILAAALETARPAADAKQIVLRTEFDPTVGTVNGDPERLQQVFWNLLSNAVKFTPRLGRVEVRLERTRSRAVVKVVDNGIGIRSDVMPFIFDRFRQADSSIARAHGGLGLGLAIVRQLVELHGGTVEATSPGEGQGSTFTVSLPVAPLREPQRGDWATAAGDLARCDGIYTLLVDDEVDGRELMTILLERCGGEVTAVESAAEALAAIGRRRPDVLVSDLAMPGVDGYELIRRVRALPGGASIPAIALTAHASADARVQAFRAGFDTYVAKPVDPAEFVAAVSRLARRAGPA